MSFRALINHFREAGSLLQVDAPVSRTYQLAGLLKAVEPQPALFTGVAESPFRVAGNLLCSKAVVADYYNIPVEGIIPMLARGIESPLPPSVVKDAPCQEVVIRQPDLDALPILRHCEEDGGNYISSGVFVARHPRYGQNLDFHRGMQFSKNEMAVRVVQGRHFDRFLQELGQVDVAVCIGVAPAVLLAAATSVTLGCDELHIANALEQLTLVRAVTSDLYIPAECEFVLEGTVYLNRRHAEGPFVDLTETYDVVRQEPVLEVKAITHRKDAIWHALLPGGLEHKLLMGMPREPTIYRQVNQVARCLDVNVNPGGCSWLHAIVQIDKQADDDGLKAIQAAFEGHRSCKHVFVVDADIDIYDPLSVEWAMATRFQGDRNLVVKERSPGSSLDPSAEPDTHLTTRVGFDLTKPLKSAGKNFAKASFPPVDVERYLPAVSRSADRKTSCGEII